MSKNYSLLLISRKFRVSVMRELCWNGKFALVPANFRGGGNGDDGMILFINIKIANFSCYLEFF